MTRKHVLYFLVQTLAFVAFFGVMIVAFARGDVTGPVVGVDASGNLLTVTQAAQGSAAYEVEPGGFFYFRGIAYGVGSPFAATELLYCKNHNL